MDSSKLKHADSVVKQDSENQKEKKISFGRIIVRHILFFLLLVLVNNVLIFLLREPDKLYVYTAKKAARENAGEIDALLFGSSHTAYGIDPMAFDEALGWTTFNAGTMLQDMQGAYYYLKDFNRNGDIRHVVLNLSYSSWSSDYRNDSKSLIILDRMSSPLIYAEYAFEALSLDTLYDLFFIPYRYRSNAELSIIRENVMGKLQKEYLYTKKTADGTVRDFPYMGFSPVSSSITSDFRRMPDPAQWVVNEKSIENETYLRKIMEYCADENIEVVFLSTPFTDSYIMQLKKYDTIRSYFQQLADEYGVPYYDFNMIRNEYYSIDPSYFWEDCHHMNFKGAVSFSKAFADLLVKAEAGEDVSGYFYGNYREYVEDYKEIAGVRIRTKDLGDLNYRIRIVPALGDGVEAEYQVLARLEGTEEYQMIRDYSDETLFEWTAWQIGNYQIRVNARYKGSTSEYDVYNDLYALTMNSKMQEAK